MALSAGAVVAQFDGDFKGLNKGLQDAQSKVNNFTSDIKKAGNKIGEVFSNIGDAAIKYGKILGVAGTAATVFGIKTAADLQSLSTSFETLTGSAEKGRKVFTDLKKMGATTPFEVGDLAKATQTMLAFGISVDKTQGYLQMLGDISMGNKDKLGGLALAFSQVQSTGRLMGQDLLQMINQGFNPLLVLAQKNIGERMGLDFQKTQQALKDNKITTGQVNEEMIKLKKAMEDGKVSATDVAKAFELSTSEGGLFYKGMERGSKTLSGTFSTLMDNIKLMGSGLAGLSDDGTIAEGSLLDLTQKGVNALNEALGKVNWLQVGQAIQKALVEAPQRASEAFQSFLKFIQPIMPFLTVLGGLLLFLGTQVLSAFRYAWEQLKPPIMDLWNTLKAFWIAIQPILMLLGTVLLFVVLPMIQIAIASIVQVFKGLLTGVSGIINVISGILNAFIGLVYGIFTGDFSRATEGFKQIFRGLGQWIQGAFQLILAPFRGIIDGITNYMRGINFFQIAVNWMQELIRGIQSKAGGIGGAIKQGIGNMLPEGVRKLIPGFADGVRNFGGGMAIVGERGPELVNLPKGADVFSNEESKRMAGGQGITIETMNIKSGVDWEIGASYLAQKLRLS
jgi:phage-related protein